MAKWAQGIYEVQNPQKYVGKGKPRYRSGWELTFMRFCDSNDKIVNWASEAISIPYRNPFTGKQTVYIPDFFIVYQDRTGRVVSEVVEIKPKKQTVIEEKITSARDRMAVALNHAKWQAAQAYCKRIGVTFRVITEDQIFYNGRR
jgi:TnsA endonuclease N terminal